MNSYFEQSGFYGHPHQAGGMGMTTAAHDQSASAYRGFPLSLGMSPYTNHHLHQTRSTQQSPYDASISAACSKIYDGSYNNNNNNANTANNNKDCAKTGTATTPTNNSSAAVDTNGYKDVWNTSSSSSTGGPNSSVPVRPSACTPDSRVGGYLDTSGSPASRGGSGSAAWNNNCSTIGGSVSSQAAAASAAGLHQSSNHTFYPWMAIAGQCSTFRLVSELALSVLSVGNQIKVTTWWFCISCKSSVECVCATANLIRLIWGGISTMNSILLLLLRCSSTHASHNYDDDDQGSFDISHLGYSCWWSGWVTTDCPNLFHSDAEASGL